MIALIFLIACIIIGLIVAGTMKKDEKMSPYVMPIIRYGDDSDRVGFGIVFTIAIYLFIMIGFAGGACSHSCDEDEPVSMDKKEIHRLIEVEVASQLRSIQSKAVAEDEVDEESEGEYFDENGEQYE